MTTLLKMPQLGESVVEGTIIRWLKQPGDTVKEYEPLVEVETDKVVTEVTATGAGILLQILVTTGQTAKVGTVLAYLGQPGEVPPLNEVTAATNVELDQPTPPASKRRRFTPVVKRLLEAHNILLEELQSLAGTGRGGRISKRDVLRYIETRSHPPSPQPTPAPISQPVYPSPPPPLGDGAGQSIELTPMRSAIAEHMLRSVQTSPHVTSVFEVDMSRVVAYRQAHREEFARRGTNLAYTAFFVQAAVKALKAYPMANTSLIDGKLVMHPHINISIAVAIQGGLLVPVIKRAEELSLEGLAAAVNDVATRARSKKLTPDDVQGGTFTVTNPGMQGALFGTAIINQPQAAILGIGAIKKRPVVLESIEGDAIAIRPMVYLSLTYDHRIMDGFGTNYVLAAIRDFLEGYQ